MTGTVGGVPHLGLSFEDESLISEQLKFCFWRILACIMIRTHDEEMECKDCARAGTGFISSLCTVHMCRRWRCASDEDVWVRWLEKCVLQPPRCLQCVTAAQIYPQKLKSTWSYLHSMSSVLYLFDAFWRFLGFQHRLMIIFHTALSSTLRGWGLW